MGRELKATPELIKQISAFAAGKGFTTIHRKFPQVSESLLYVILRENEIEFDKGKKTGESRRTLQRKGEWVPGKNTAKARIAEYNNQKPGIFRHEDYNGII